MAPEKPESIIDIIKTIEDAKAKNNFDKFFDWAFRLAIGFLIWYSVKTVEKVDMTSDKINAMGSQIEIIKHDNETIRRDVSKLESSFDKLSDKK